MAYDLPCVSYMALYIVSMHIINSNSRTSTHWKLNTDTGKVQSAVAADGPDMMDDPLLSILTNKIPLENGQWKLEPKDQTCSENCQKKYDKFTNKQDEEDSTNHSTPRSRTSNKLNKPEKKKKKAALDCGKIANSTQFDYLPGIAERHNHPHIPEPEVAMIFKKKNSHTAEVDMNDLEKRLKKAKKEKKTAVVYNQIGNFWRIKGNTQMSIECFRKALSLSPASADVLLNLARVLFNLQYLDDAIVLTRRSLEVQSPDQISWLQHFTLGEILKARGNYHDATLHFRHTLDLNPGFQPAQAHLREMEVSPDATVTYYTLFIILFLVLGVLCGILTSIDSSFEELGESTKTQRHFNRAMAMRSIKLGINPKLMRMRKQYNGC